MALESGTYISDLNPSNPVGATDKVSTLDDHVRLIKSTLQNTFPNIEGEVTATHTELNHLDGVTGTTGTGKLVLDDAPTIADLTVTDSITLPAASIADAALSNNVPLKDAPNTFTRSGHGLGSAAIAIASGAPTILMHETDQDADGGLWVISASSGQFRLGAVPNNYTGTISPSSMLLNATRSGASITSATINGGNEVELNATTLDFNGNADISGTLAVGGTITGNGSGLSSLNASNLSSGTVPNARLSSDVPLKNAPNVFTVQQTIQRTSGSPTLTVERVGAASNAVIEAKTTSGSVYFGNTDGSTFAIGATAGLSSPWVTVSNGNAAISGSLTAGSARIASEGGVIYHDSTNNLGGKIVLSSSPAATAGEVGAPGDMRFVYS